MNNFKKKKIDSPRVVHLAELGPSSPVALLHWESCLQKKKQKKRKTEHMGFIFSRREGGGERSVPDTELMLDTVRI